MRQQLTYHHKGYKINPNSRDSLIVSDTNNGGTTVSISRENNVRKRIIKDIRPWGIFKRYAHNEKCTVKIITVNPNQLLSKQVHRKRNELWVIIDEGLRVELTCPHKGYHSLS